MLLIPKYFLTWNRFRCRNRFFIYPDPELNPGKWCGSGRIWIRIPKTGNIISVALATCAGHASPWEGLGPIAAGRPKGGGAARDQDPLLGQRGRGEVGVVVGQAVHFTHLSTQPPPEVDGRHFNISFYNAVNIYCKLKFISIILY